MGGGSSITFNRPATRETRLCDERRLDGGLGAVGEREGDRGAFGDEGLIEREEVGDLIEGVRIKVDRVSGSGVGEVTRIVDGEEFDRK
jgi:hypothetical protein